MRRRLVISLGVVVVVLGAAGLYLRPIAPVATGYAAKLVCSGHFVANRTVEDVQGDLPDNPLVPFLRTRANEDGGVRVTLLGLWGSTAWFHPSHGCTLADTRPVLPAMGPVAGPDPVRMWPDGDGVDLAAEGLDRERLLAALDAAFAEDDPQGRVKGTRAVVVVHGGRIVAERYADGFGADTPLIGWSMAKSVTNALIGRLVMDGALTVDDDDLLPQWHDDARSTITLADLLHMTSGLEFAEVYDPGTDATTMLFRPGKASALPAAKPLVADPGALWSYSSGTSNIVCEVAGRAAGGAPTTMAHDLVFAPLGMSSAVLEPDASGTPVCSSFLYATPRDWARFGLWFLRDGRWKGEQLLPEDWVAWSTTPVALETEEPYGAHWWLNVDADGNVLMPSVPADAYMASGHEGQRVVVIPSADLVVVRMGLTPELEWREWGLEPLLAEVVAATR